MTDTTIYVHNINRELAYYTVAKLHMMDAAQLSFNHFIADVIILHYSTATTTNFITSTKYYKNKLCTSRNSDHV